MLSVPLEYKYNKANKILKKSAWPWQGGNDKGDTTTVRTLSPRLQDAEASVTTTKGRRDSGFTFPYLKQYLPFFFFFFSFYFKKASISQGSRSCTLFSCNFVTAHSQCCEEQLLSPCHLPAEELTRKYNLFCHYSEDKKNKTTTRRKPQKHRYLSQVLLENLGILKGPRMQIRLRSILSVWEALVR